MAIKEKSLKQNNFNPEKKVFSGIVREPKKQDLKTIRTILESWIKDGETGKVIKEEVDGVINMIEDSISNKGKTRYLVAEKDKKVLGIMGFRPLADEKMKAFTQTENPVEFINAYVDPKYRGWGVGKDLLERRIEEAKKLGYTEILLNSGPRYKKTGWPFHNKMYGPPIGILTDYYGPGQNAPVWRKIL